MTSIGETAKTTVTQEGFKALIKWLFDGLPPLVAALGGMASAWGYLQVSVPAWSVAVLVGFATFLTVLFVWKLPTLYKVVGADASHQAAPGWGHSTTLHLFQAACLLEDIEPQLPVPRKAQVWVHQLAFALENGELGKLAPPDVKMDSRIQMADLRRFAQKRSLFPKCLRAGAPRARTDNCKPDVHG